MRYYLALFSVLLFFVFTSQHTMAGDYQGTKMLEVLGEERMGDAVKYFRNQYLLDKALKNPENGLKLIATHDSASIIVSLTITAAGYEMNDIKYKQFNAAIPFNISLADDEEALVQKLGAPKGLADDVKLKFKKDGITIHVFFKSAAKKKINYIKFTQNIGAVGPYRIDGGHDAPAPIIVATAKPAVTKPTPKGSDNKEARMNAAKANVYKGKPTADNMTVSALPMPAEFAAKAVATTVSKASKSPFYTAVMNVFESGEEEMFKDIKKTPADKANFWNYKYTYATSVAIPGEKYNMLYSFPFQSSQLDFVSVLEETDQSSRAIELKYADVEAKLKEEFKLTEGWSYSYTRNQEDPNGIKDLELKNSKLGSIVLDHSINPYGKHVLYLRFLLQYN